MNIGVTTILKASRPVKEKAKRKAVALGYPYIDRQGTLPEMREKTGVEGFLIYGKSQPLFWTAIGVYGFHVGTAVLRISQMKKGNTDRLCALLPSQGVHVLDCTFGHGGDATVLSWFLGKKGQVTALEKSDVLYEIGREGIHSWVYKNQDITESVRRIHLIHGDFKNILQGAEEDSFDVVYFDTMFKHPVKRQENKMEGFRQGAIYDTVTEDDLRRAMKVARYEVIVKERPFSKLFASSLFTAVHEKHGQSTAYGVIETWKKKS